MSDYVNMFIAKIVESGQYCVYTPYGVRVSICRPSNMNSILPILEDIPDENMQTLIEQFDIIDGRVRNTHDKFHTINKFFKEAEDMGYLKFVPYIKDDVLVLTWNRYISYFKDEGFVLSTTPDGASLVSLTTAPISNIRSMLEEHHMTGSGLCYILLPLTFAEACSQPKLFSTLTLDYTDIVEEYLEHIAQKYNCVCYTSGLDVFTSNFEVDSLHMPDTAATYIVENKHGDICLCFRVTPDCKMEVTYFDDELLTDVTRYFRLPGMVNYEEFTHDELLILESLLVRVGLLLCDARADVYDVVPSGSQYPICKQLYDDNVVYFTDLRDLRVYK